MAFLWIILNLLVWQSGLVAVEPPDPSLCEERLEQTMSAETLAHTFQQFGRAQTSDGTLTYRIRFFTRVYLFLDQGVHQGLAVKSLDSQLKSEFLRRIFDQKIEQGGGFIFYGPVEIRENAVFFGKYNTFMVLSPEGAVYLGSLDPSQIGTSRETEYSKEDVIRRLRENAAAIEKKQSNDQIRLEPLEDYLESSLKRTGSDG